VRPDDAIGIVGDDALWLARALDGTGTHVVVAPCRADALLLAAKLAPRIVVDGLLQARPRRVAVGILVLDAARPWGAGACPPAGDLRAPRRVLEAVADCRLVVGGTPSAEVGEHAVARVESRGAFAPDGTLLPWSVLAATRIGVLLGVARPERILCTLGSRGIRPAAVSLLADHAPPGAFAVAAASHPRPDAWLVTSKCRVKLAATLCGAPVLEIEHELELPPALQKRLLAA
jgi:tetraacyldisaccharide 4'-kinase